MQSGNINRLLNIDLGSLSNERIKNFVALPFKILFNFVKEGPAKVQLLSV